MLTSVAEVFASPCRASCFHDDRYTTFNPVNPEPWITHASPSDRKRMQKHEASGVSQRKAVRMCIICSYLRRALARVISYDDKLLFQFCF